MNHLSFVHLCDQASDCCGHQAMVQSNSARAAKFGRSMMERLMNDCKAHFTMLDSQFRMGPAISAFPSAHFYNFKLQDHPSVVSRASPWLQLEQAPWAAQLLAQSSPASSGSAVGCCVHVDGVEAAAGPSLINRREAKVHSDTRTKPDRSFG